MAQAYRVLDQLKQLSLEKMRFFIPIKAKNHIKKVADVGLTQSMSCRGNCWDNACIENFFRHRKAEMPFFSSPQTLEEVK